MKDERCQASGVRCQVTGVTRQLVEEYHISAHVYYVPVVFAALNVFIPHWFTTLKSHIGISHYTTTLVYHIGIPNSYITLISHIRIGSQCSSHLQDEGFGGEGVGDGAREEGGDLSE